MPETFRCGRCGAHADRVLQQGMTADPPRWITVTVQALPVRNLRLCPACADRLDSFLRGWRPEPTTAEA